MSGETPLPKGHPMLVAWEQYKATEAYSNSFRWAAHEQHRDGSMWAAFVAGWNAATPPAPAESQRTTPIYNTPDTWDELRADLASGETERVIRWCQNDGALRELELQWQRLVDTQEGRDE